MTIKTPEQIAREVLGASNWITPDGRDEFMDAMTAAIEADRAQRNTLWERDDDGELTPAAEREYEEYLDQQFWGDH